MLILGVTVVLVAMALLLIWVPGPSVAHLRLRLVVTGPPPRRSARARGEPVAGRGGSLPTAAAVALAPAVALAAVAGPGPALLLGLPAGVGLWWGLRRVHTAPERQRHAKINAGLPLALDLLVAGVRAGGSPQHLLDALSESLPDPLGAVLGEVAERQRLGATPAEAWAAVSGPTELATVGRAMARAADTGAPLADLLEHHAGELRRRAHGAALAQTQRTAVLVVAPLGLCFLPAFVLIGVVPLVASLIGDLAPL